MNIVQSKMPSPVIGVILLPLLLLGCSESKEIQQVKGGVLQLCPKHTVKQMVDGFDEIPIFVGIWQG